MNTPPESNAKNHETKGKNSIENIRAQRTRLLFTRLGIFFSCSLFILINVTIFADDGCRANEYIGGLYTYKEYFDIGCWLTYSLLPSIGILFFFIGIGWVINSIFDPLPTQDTIQDAAKNFSKNPPNINIIEEEKSAHDSDPDEYILLCGMCYFRVNEDARLCPKCGTSILSYGKKVSLEEAVSLRRSRIQPWIRPMNRGIDSHNTLLSYKPLLNKQMRLSISP